MIEYSEEWIFLLLFKREGSVGRRALWFALPAALIAFLLVLIDELAPDFRRKHGMLEANPSAMWAGTASALIFLLGLRSNRAMGRFWEGTSLLHQMRGEWFDSVSCCITFTRAALVDKKEEVLNFRQTIVRLMSLCHGSALEEIAGHDGLNLATIDPSGLDNATLKHLKDCHYRHQFNRVEVVLHMVQILITCSLDEGILKIPPPILSRVYQTLSRGFVNHLNAKKITDTRFPFPYAQLISYMLVLNLFLTPFIMSSMFASKIWAPIITFVPVFALCSLNTIAIELENPFGNDDNDLPLDHFQADMNDCLLMLLQENSDIKPTVNIERCEQDFNTLRAMVRGRGEYSRQKTQRVSDICADFKIDSSRNSADFAPEARLANLQQSRSSLQSSLSAPSQRASQGSLWSTRTTASSTIDPTIHEASSSHLRVPAELPEVQFREEDDRYGAHALKGHDSATVELRRETDSSNSLSYSIAAASLHVTASCSEDNAGRTAYHGLAGGRIRSKAVPAVQEESIAI